MWLQLFLFHVVLARSAATSAPSSCILPIRSRSHCCDCTDGFLLRVEWFGRLGNNLLQLAHVLHLAEQTKSEVIVPDAAFLSRRQWDFRSGAGTGCQIAVSSSFFYSSACPMYLDKTVFPAAAKRSILQTHVLPAFTYSLEQPRDVVVVHIRGGDVFSTSPPPTYTQPPAAFYRTVLQLPELAKLKIILCVEDFSNPVVEILQKDFRRRLTTVTDLSIAIGTIVGAKHLVLGQSSFSEMLGMMAPNLESVYIPFCVGREDIYMDLRQHGWKVPGYCFQYDNYIPIDDWRNTADQLQLMTNLTSDKVHSYILPTD